MVRLARSPGDGALVHHGERAWSPCAGSGAGDDRARRLSANVRLAKGRTMSVHSTAEPADGQQGRDWSHALRYHQPDREGSTGEAGV
ncbi:MAG: hypothetical protein NZM04_02650 [Methylacidiphilales bacterium]|nr:hypothetical protein [Candidatus Methylacidiphilales bacterium]